MPGARCCRDAAAPLVIVLSNYGNDVENGGDQGSLGERGEALE